MENYFLPNLIESFINWLKEKRMSQFTLIAYKKDLSQFVGFLAGQEKYDVREIKKEDIVAFIKKILSENYTQKSASRKLNSIRTFFRYLKNNNLISQNPALEVAHPKYSQTPPRILSKMEYRALRDAAREDKRSYAIIEILLQTGIRIGELASLRISDIKNNSLYIRPYGKSPERNVFLNPAAKKAIDDYLKIRPKTDLDFLFITRNGKPLLIRNIRQIISRYFNEVGIEKATVNDLRNTFIAHQLIKGSSLEYVSKIVGHRRLSSTERYLSLVNSQVKKREKIEEL
ncbi:MAG: tyrosine-type recombinase/integrase [Patescibacteria group bacterium]|nr:tyrosine-type recombinase/integrase [Patescibacteria group bacterium]